MKKLNVVATSVAVPMEGSRKTIGPDEPKSVPETVYYRRRIRTGELCLAEERKKDLK